METAVPWWLRAYFLFATLQLGALGVTGFVSPDDIQIPLRMTPLNVRFVAALYLTSAVAVLLAALSRRRAEARLFALGFAFGTLVITLQIFVRWNDYMAPTLPHREGFLGAYLLDLALALVVVPTAGYLTIPPRARNRLTPLFLVEATTFAVVGVVLLVAPNLAAKVWPWALPSVLSQLYAAFFLSLALGAFLAAGEAQPRAIRSFTLTSFALTVFVLVASLLHLPRFKPEPVTWVWFAVFGVGAVAFATALAGERVIRSRGAPMATSIGG